MSDLEQAFTAIFGGIVLLAIVSVIVSKKSQAPQAIQSIGSVVSNVVAAAVNPVTQNYGSGNLGLNTFSLPSIGTFVGSAAAPSKY